MLYKKILITSFILLILVTLLGCNVNTTQTQDLTGSLHVLVLNPDSNPVNGAKVVSNTQPDGQLKVTGITSGDGTVTYNDIKPGKYEFYISSQYPQKEFEVTIVARKTTNITITLES